MLSAARVDTNVITKKTLCLQHNHIYCAGFITELLINRITILTYPRQTT